MNLKLLIVKWVVLTGAIGFTAWFLDGIRVTSLLSAVAAAAALGVLNTFFRPIALLLTLPLNIISLGLFTFLINALMLKLASSVIPGFYVVGFWAAVWGAILISATNWGISWLLAWQSKPSVSRTEDFIDLEQKGKNRWE